MIPESGYWRSGKYTDTFWSCPNPDACLGGSVDDDEENIPVGRRLSLSEKDYTGSCLDGYKGNM